MPQSQSWRLAGSATFILVAASCSSLEVEPVQIALISVPTTRTEAGGFTTAPYASFIEGIGNGLSSTVVGQEGCVTRAYTGGSGNQSFDYIDAGTAITARFDGPDGSLTKVVDGARIRYQLAAASALAFTPGQTITFQIPGAEGGFPARLVAARTAEAFTPSAITLPANTADDLTVTWTPVPEVAGSAMFYSIRYSSPGMTVVDREIACVFRDDGSGVITAAMFNEFRQASIRQAFAQRARITANRIGNVITHVTSTFETPIVLTDAT